MKTEIFKSYRDFINREDKEVNGVNEEFAAEHPEYVKDNETNKGCWNCSDCSGCSDCSRCSRCSDCSRCSGCSDCSGWKNNQPPFDMSKIPVIENIHQKILEAITAEGCQLRMDTWHASEELDDKGGYCGTTHCRAGWVVALAGADGRALELHTSTEFAAMQILHKSCQQVPVSPVRFYESDEIAMADIKRCAELEKAL